MTALQFSLESNEKAIQGISKLGLGRVIAKKDLAQIEAAEQHILDGIMLLEELGLKPLYGCGYVWLGEVYLEYG